MSRYPAVSHTFFLHEITGLRRLGLHIRTASINPVDSSRHRLSEIEDAESKNTFYLKGRPAAAWIPALLSIASAHPKVALRGFMAALRLESWHLTHTIYALFYFAEALLLGDWMRQHQLRHLHIHFCGPVASVGMITALAWKLPYSLTVHGPDEFFDQRETALVQKIANAGFVICISEYCRSQLMRITPPSTWNKLRVIRLGIQPELAVDTGRKVADRGQTTILQVLCTGRLVGAKGQAILILAATTLLKKGHRLHVTLIGDGEDRNVLEALVDENEIRQEVTFTGSQSHESVLAALRQSDVFVLPSFAEGVPVALMEAMAMGVPCVSTFIAGIPELIRHEKDGLLVPAGSVEALAEAMERLILNPQERAGFQKSALQQVMTNYNLSINLTTLASALTELAPYAVNRNEELS